MSKILDKATAHFRNQISGEMKSVNVPEWETKVFFKSATNLRDEGKIVELSQAGKATEALVESLIIKARNEDGTKMFSPADKAALMNEVDPKVLIRVVSEINSVTNAEDLSMESVEKN
jgi:hypothetical protein